MLTTEWPVTTPAMFQGWLQEILTPQQIDGFSTEKEFDGSHAFSFVRVRINLLDSLRGSAMVLRLIPQTILSLEDLNLPDVLRDLSSRPKGLVLVTGPTGSGKSTTLAAMIDWINSNQTRHILTIEDPVEFVHNSKKSLIRHREVGQHTLKFHNALRASLREDPDVILVGEIRDRETLSTALEASQTGHLVFGTLHTTGSARTVNRMIDAFPANQQEQIRAQLSVSLVAVISQVLIPHASGKGRVAAFEVMVNTPAIGNLIRKNETNKIQSTIQTSRRMGMMTLDDSIYEHASAGRIEKRAALDFAQNPADLEARL